MYLFFFFNDTATTEIYTLSLHDALPICAGDDGNFAFRIERSGASRGGFAGACYRNADRKSTRLNSSHSQISYAVFCLKKKKNKAQPILATRSTKITADRHAMLTTHSTRG